MLKQLRVMKNNVAYKLIIEPKRLKHPNNTQKTNQQRHELSSDGKTIMLENTTASPKLTVECSDSRKSFTFCTRKTQCKYVNLGYSS